MLVGIVVLFGGLYTKHNVMGLLVKIWTTITSISLGLEIILLGIDKLIVDPKYSQGKIFNFTLHYSDHFRLRLLMSSRFLIPIHIAVGVITNTAVYGWDYSVIDSYLTTVDPVFMATCIYKDHPKIAKLKFILCLRQPNVN